MRINECFVTVSIFVVATVGQPPRWQQWPPFWGFRVPNLTSGVPGFFAVVCSVALLQFEISRFQRSDPNDHSCRRTMWALNWRCSKLTWTPTATLTMSLLVSSNVVRIITLPSATPPRQTAISTFWLFQQANILVYLQLVCNVHDTTCIWIPTRLGYVLSWMCVLRCCWLWGWILDNNYSGRISVKCTVGYYISFWSHYIGIKPVIVVVYALLWPGHWLPSTFC